MLLTNSKLKIRMFEFEYSKVEFEVEILRFSMLEFKDLGLVDLNAVFTIEFVSKNCILI